MGTEQSPEPERNNVRLFVQAYFAARLGQGCMPEGIMEHIEKTIYIIG